MAAIQIVLLIDVFSSVKVTSAGSSMHDHIVIYFTNDCLIACKR